MRKKNLYIHTIIHYEYKMIENKWSNKTKQNKQEKYGNEEEKENHEH